MGMRSTKLTRPTDLIFTLFIYIKNIPLSFLQAFMAGVTISIPVCYVGHWSLTHSWAYSQHDAKYSCPHIGQTGMGVTNLRAFVLPVPPLSTTIMYFKNHPTKTRVDLLSYQFRLIDANNPLSFLRCSHHIFRWRGNINRNKDTSPSNWFIQYLFPASNPWVTHMENEIWWGN